MNPTPNQIRELIAASGLSMREVAALGDWHRSTVEHWVYGKRDISKSNWKLLNMLLQGGRK